jgi:sarcosine oxidase subunit alpha
MTGVAGEDLRIEDHPVLGAAAPAREVTIWLDGKPITAREGEPLAAALYALGVRRLGLSPRRREPRGAFCMVGKCSECLVFVEGMGSVRACRTPVEEGMRVWRYEGGRPLFPGDARDIDPRGGLRGGEGLG